MTPAPLSVQEIVEEINRHCKSTETVEDVIAIGKGLVALFGFKKLKVPGLLKLSKRQYSTLALKPEYSWARRLMHVAMDPKINNPDNLHRLPSGRTHLHELRLMKLARFQQGLKEDADRDGEIVIHPASNREDLKLYRIQEQQIKPRSKPRYVIVVIPQEDAEIDDALDSVRSAAFNCECGVMIAEVISTKAQERTFGDRRPDDTSTVWTLRQTERIEKRTKEQWDHE